MATNQGVGIVTWCVMLARHAGRGGALALALAACGGSGPDPAPPPASAPSSAAASDDGLELARVDDAVITLGRVRAFYAKMPDELQSGRVGADKLRDHLQTLIDMKLLLLEAEARVVERSPAFVAKMKGYQHDRVVGQYLRDRIEVQISPDEIREFFAAQGLKRTVRFGQIIAATLDSARQAVADVAGGATFAEVARMWSIHKATAANGGDTGKYVTRLDLPPELADRLFALSVGELSEPIDLGGAYGVFTVLTEFESELAGDVIPVIYQRLFAQRSAQQRAAFVDSLKGRFHLQLVPDGLQALRAALDRGDDGGERPAAVFTYDGGQVTVRDVVESVGPLEVRSLAGHSDAALVERLERSIAGDALLLQGAIADGFHQRPEIAAWLERKREEELIVQLRVQILEAGVTISDDEVRREYEQNPDRYRRAEQIEIQEVLVATQAEAEDVLARVRAGESLGAVARAQSLRPAAERDAEGRFAVSLAMGRKYGRLCSAAWRTKVGDLGGPVHVAEGYSVFKVLSRHSEPATFAESERRARATVNWVKKQLVFDAFLQELRSRYADRVRIAEANLERAATAPG